MFLITDSYCTRPQGLRVFKPVPFVQGPKSPDSSAKFPRLLHPFPNPSCPTLTQALLTPGSATPSTLPVKVASLIGWVGTNSPWARDAELRALTPVSNLEAQPKQSQVND